MQLAGISSDCGVCALVAAFMLAFSATLASADEAYPINYAHRPNSACPGPAGAVIARSAHPDPALSRFEVPAREICGRRFSPDRTDAVLLLGEGVPGGDLNDSIGYMRLFDRTGENTPDAYVAARGSSPHLPDFLRAVCRDPQTGLDQMLFVRADSGTGADHLYFALHVEGGSMWSYTEIGTYWLEGVEQALACAAGQSALGEGDGDSGEAFAACSCAWRPRWQLNVAQADLDRALLDLADRADYPQPGGTPGRTAIESFQPRDAGARDVLLSKWRNLTGFPVDESARWSNAALQAGPFSVEAVYVATGWSSAIYALVSENTAGRDPYFLRVPFVSSNYGTAVDAEHWSLQPDGWLVLRMYQPDTGEFVPHRLRVHSDPSRRALERMP